MQHTLTFEKDKKKYVSKPFDFEALCMIGDAHGVKENHSIFSICRDAIDYLFEGTEATQDIIDSMDVKEHAKMCLTLWNFYIDVLSSKNE